MSQQESPAITLPLTFRCTTDGCGAETKRAVEVSVQMRMVNGRPQTEYKIVPQLPNGWKMVVETPAIHLPGTNPQGQLALKCAKCIAKLERTETTQEVH